MTTIDTDPPVVLEGLQNVFLSLADPFLALSSDIVDDLERTRIANENRLRQLIRSEADSDGEERGFGLTLDHPDVQNLRMLVDGLSVLEQQAVKQMSKRMKSDKLGPYVKGLKGVGDKQAARLIAVIGDPYINSSTGQPRTVSQLWAYCGLHVLDGSAARRKKGVKANWSTTAKTRAYLISESMLRSGNREAYDKRRDHTEGKLHDKNCVRCGPSGKPALEGSPWSAGHCHADALRYQSKELLKGLWRESRRLHGVEDTDGQESVG